MIDPPNSPGHGRLWSHLASDESFEELHRFAAQLGIPPRGFDGDHYDIPAERYAGVVAAGVVPVSSRELLTRLRRAGLRRRKADRLVAREPGSPLVRPARLRHGDAVTVASPAGPVSPTRVETGLAVLRSWGLSVTLTADVTRRDELLSYLSGPDSVRAEDFTAAWCDPTVRAVFCARGGYGAQRIVDLLDWDALASAGPKILLGFSDITALHQAFATRLGLSTIHGPVVTSLAAGDEAAREHLRGLLFDSSRGLSLTPSPAPALVPGRAEGVLVGGNLALLAAELGTAGSRPAAGSIAVLEDVGEELYRVDRLVTQLLRAGWFDDVRAVALGQLTDCGAPDTLRHLFEDRLGPLGVPVLWDLPFGHLAGNLAFPLGVRAALDADRGTLVLVDSALV